MEVFITAPSVRFSKLMFPDGSVVWDVLNRFVEQQGVPSGDFYVIRNGQRSGLDNPLQQGAVYHLEPRLCGGKGGFGSMLRALGAQIEKTTNREACRDLSGRRLRDVNHEKEMAEWLKKQAEREAEKEQRRLERLQRKLSEKKHYFADPEYQQQCHDLSERLEDSVIKGLQASSGCQVRADDAVATKRPSSGQSEQLHTRKKKKMAAYLWTGVDDLLSSDDEDEDESPSTSSSCGAAPVATITQTEEEEPDQSSSSSPSSECSSSLAPLTAKPEEEGLRSADEGRSHEEEGLRSADVGRSHEEEGLRSADVGRSHEEEGLRSADEGRSHEEEGLRSADEGRRTAEEGPRLADKGRRPAEEGLRLADEGRRPAEEGRRPAEEGQTPVEASGDHPVRPTEDPEASKTSESSCSSQQQQQESRSPLDLSSLSSVDQLESLGLDVLKKELMSRGLKCGGTVTERATRLFSIRGLTPDQINPALLAKPAKARRK